MPSGAACRTRSCCCIPCWRSRNISLPCFVQMIHTKEQRSKVLVTGVPWKDADSSAMDKERVPSRLNMLLRLHHGVLMECAAATRGKLVLGRKKTNQKTALTAPRGRSRRVAWSKPILAIHAQICKQGASLLNYRYYCRATSPTMSLA